MPYETRLLRINKMRQAQRGSIGQAELSCHPAGLLRFNGEVYCCGLVRLGYGENIRQAFCSSLYPLRWWHDVLDVHTLEIGAAQPDMRHAFMDCQRSQGDTQRHR